MNLTFHKKYSLLVGMFIVAVCTVIAAIAAKPAQAETQVINILNPTPGAVLFLNTQILFEVQIKSGPDGDYAIDWQTQWDGITPAFVPDAGSHSTVHLVSTNFPATGKVFPQLRYQPTIRDGGVGQKRVRVRVTVGGDEELATGLYYLADYIPFSGYTWMGASSPICISGPRNGLVCGSDADCQPGGKCGNDALGWDSFSCANQNTVCSNPNVHNYGVQIGTINNGTVPNATLLNNAWIGDPSGGYYSFGWMSFNRKYCNGGGNPGGFCLTSDDCTGGTCDALGDPPLIPAPNSEMEGWATQPTASYVYNSVFTWNLPKRYPDQVSGWARLLTLRDYGANPPISQPDWGWVHLRGISVTPFPTGGFHQCSDCSADKSKCNICAKAVQNPGDPESAWKSYSCNSCYACDGSGNCNTCESCDTYGVSYDAQQGKLVGFAYGSGENQAGIGWMQFDPTLGGIGILQAWLATRYGDIFANSRISKTGALPAPPGSFNATYVIQSNGTIEFSSQAGYLQPQYPTTIPLPSSTNQYINVLGRLDLNEMTKHPTNRYGTTEVITDPNATINAWGNKQLGGKIYWVQGDLTIDNPIEFQPGPAQNDSGAGTIIVDGDLTINAPITYNTTDTIGRIINLPSVTWIVRGNLFINPDLGSTGRRCNGGTNQGLSCNVDAECPPSAACVESAAPDMVGAYIVVGSPSGGTTVQCSGQDLKGVVSTGQHATLQLIVNGLMMARCFNFERNVPATKGSEQIVYDGRLIANPPPGLQDLTAVLPVIREVTP